MISRLQQKLQNCLQLVCVPDIALVVFTLRVRSLLALNFAPRIVVYMVTYILSPLSLLLTQKAKCRLRNGARAYPFTTPKL